MTRLRLWLASILGSGGGAPSLLRPSPDLRADTEGEAFSVYWARRRRLPAALHFVSGVLSEELGVADISRYRLDHPRAGERILIEESDAEAFADALDELLEIPILDWLELFLPAAGRTVDVHFEGSRGRGSLSVALPGVAPERISAVATRLSAELALRIETPYS